MRIGELAALQWEDIDFHSHRIRVYKTLNKTTIFYREFDSWIVKKVLAGRIKPASFVSNFCFYICYFLLLCGIIRSKVLHMNLHISKSKNAESFYICRSYVKANGSTSSMIARKLGTLEQLLIEHGPTRDDVLAWAKNEVKIETEKYKKENEEKTVLIPFHADRHLDYDKQIFFRGGYLFLQSIYY